MSSPCPQSHRYHFPNQVTKLVLKRLQRGQADCYQHGILRPSGHVPAANISCSISIEVEQGAFVSMWGPSFPRRPDPPE